MARQHLRVFVACGTGLRFGRLLDLVAPLASEPEVDLFVQRGESAFDFAALPGAASLSRVQFSERVSWADVVICHGGAGTLHEAIRAGHRPLVLTRLAEFQEHVNDHQEELVDALVRRGLVARATDCVDVAQLCLLKAERSAPSPSLRAPGLIDAVSEALSLAPGRARPAQSMRTMRGPLVSLWRRAALALRKE